MDKIKIIKVNGCWAIIGIMVLAVLALIAIGVGGDYISKYRTIKAAKEKVANQLKDPSSVQFKNVTTDGGLVCGEVNGKNSLGGYVGYTHFSVLEDQVQIDEDEDEYKFAKKLCEKLSIK